ncbi:carbon-nitrogen hydrolase family protein [Aliishimia ponticola]|uniref:Carbon-nitrogen hydrolase family protein n=1 Tax=Aliishimia ponticola TaxID=2499833 RepID=A0A4S4N7Z7_9RHOB|nr:carbon-nitrogen hydrolase family protein [Aliishimia ponticola]THH34675.1 carbon-nitrogen hydrolase family protein [Aliishimia ponticola]
MTRAAILQLSSSDLPEENLATVLAMMADAVAQGAEFVLTPEVTNCVSTSRTHQQSVLSLPDDDATLAALKAAAAEHGIWVLIGSLALKTGDVDGRFANRSILVNPTGEIVAQYDKIHMFDVDIDEHESHRESSGYRPGARAVVADAPFGPVGLSVCYDMRFPQLYQALARAGARVLTAPAAFSPVTGAAHWHSLLRARAIETGCFVIAPAQTGTHRSTTGKERSTYGHSLVISPWGEVLLDAGTETGVYMFDLDLDRVDDARRRVPSLQNARSFEGP